MKLLLIVSLCAVSAFAGEIVSKQGGKCLTAESGAKEGSRIVASNCTGASTENFFLDGARMTLVGTELCVQADSRNSVSEMRLRKCNTAPAGDALQNFGFHGSEIGHNTGLCLDLKGGTVGPTATMIPWVNQPAILFNCNKQPNQAWMTGTFKSGQTVTTIEEGTQFWIPGMSGLFEKKGGKIVAQGSGQTIAQGSKNVVAQSGGKIIAQSTGN